MTPLKHFSYSLLYLRIMDDYTCLPEHHNTMIMMYTKIRLSFTTIENLMCLKLLFYKLHIKTLLRGGYFWFQFRHKRHEISRSYQQLTITILHQTIKKTQKKTKTFHSPCPKLQHFADHYKTLPCNSNVLFLPKRKKVIYSEQYYQ